MKVKTFVWLCSALIICSGCEFETTKPDDLTVFTGSSIVGKWACIADNNLSFNFLTGEMTSHWDYDENAESYMVTWYFDIKSNSQVQYVESEYEAGEYRKADGYLHVPADTKWITKIDANYIFDEEAQAIRCPSGTIMGFVLESTADLLGNDTIFYVKRYGKDEAVIYDNTGFFKSQYVVRVKGIKEDL